MTDIFNLLFSKILINEASQITEGPIFDFTRKADLEFFGKKHPLIIRAKIDSLKADNLYHSTSLDESRFINQDLTLIFQSMFPAKFISLAPQRRDAPFFFNAFEAINNGPAEVPVCICNNTVIFSNTNPLQHPYTSIITSYFDYKILTHFVKFFKESKYFHPEGQFYRICQLKTWLIEKLSLKFGDYFDHIESSGLTIELHFRNFELAGRFHHVLKTYHFRSTLFKSVVILSMPLTLSPNDINLIENRFQNITGETLV